MEPSPARARAERRNKRGITRAFGALLLAGAVVIAGCSGGNHNKAVYLLLDTSGTYARELERANAIVNYLLGTLETGDSLAVARIDSASFSEKDIVERVTFDGQPSRVNDQKRAFRQAMTRLFDGLDSAQYTDIRGGLLQAGEWLEETGAGARHILVFSDLKEDLPPGHKRDFDLPLAGTHVVALNVAKLRPDQVDPQRYLDRVEMDRTLPSVYRGLNEKRPGLSRAFS